MTSAIVTNRRFAERDRARGAVAQIAHALAGLAAIGLLVLSAAAPDGAENAAQAARGGAIDARYAPRRENAFGAYLGAPYHYPSDFRLTEDGQHDLTIKNVDWYTKPFDNPLYYGARIQRWLDGGRFGTMIDFVHSKAYAPFDAEKFFEGQLDGAAAPEKAKVRDFFDKLEWSHGHNMLTLNALARLGMIGRLSPYVGLGGGVSLPHSEIHLKSDESRTYEYQYTGPTAQALFGVEFRTRTGAVFIEYKFTFADYWGPLTGRDGTWLPIDLWRQFSRWMAGEEPRDGWAGARLSSHQLVSGFTVRFAPSVIATP